MYPFRIKQNAQPNRGYATCADFGEALVKDLRSLHLLALLLTGNDSEAEKCVVATIDDCAEAKSVFKGWECSWGRRCLIINAIRSVFIPRAVGAGKPPVCCECEVESAVRPGIIGLIGIAQPLQRFVFAMSVLERYSLHECALLLGCALRDVIEARIEALRQLSGINLSLTKTAEQQPQLPVVA